MKEGLMWALVLGIIGTLIPSKDWLAIFVLVICGLGCWLFKDTKGKGK